MENKKENYKIFKHAKIFNNSKLLSDCYTILDFDNSCPNFQHDIILINDFLPIPEKLIKKLEKLKAFMDKKKAIVPKTSDKIAQDLINFFQDVFTKINKRIEILHTAVNYIKDRMLDMKRALMLFSDAGSMKKKIKIRK
jgi:esterase/lipase